MTGSAIDHFGNEHLGLVARGQVSRQTLGIPLVRTPGGIALIADKIRLVLDVEAIRRA